MKKTVILLLVLFMFSVCLNAYAREDKPMTAENTLQAPSKLLVVWTSGDREVALKMVFMYTFNAKKRGWWEDIRFLIWGPSSKLLSEDEELQKEIKEMMEAGVEVVACKACADLYGVSDKLASLGIEVKYMGVPLTEMLKSSGWTTITF
jgi:hypothetical protein